MINEHEHHDDEYVHSHEHSKGASHEAGHDHSHDDPHGHGHSHRQDTTHPQTRESGPIPDLARIAVLVNNWIEHNDGHRRTYLEWRDKLANAGLPATVHALERVAALTDEATLELRTAAAELGEKLP